MSNLKKIDANIRLITTNGAKLNARIHDTAMLIAAHAAEHRDCTRALTLVKAMPASMRRSMLVEWFHTFTSIRVNVGGDKVGLLKADAKNFVAFDLKAGAAKPFYEMAKEKPEAEDLTLEDAIIAMERLVKRLQKSVDDGKVAANDSEAIVAKIASLKAVAA
jgi:hypothetical protein